MALDVCLTAAVRDGHLSEDSAREYIGKYVEFERQGFDPRQAARRVQDEIERKISRRKRMRTLQALRSEEHTQRIMAAAPEKRHKAARSVLNFDATGEFAGPSVAGRYDVVRREAFAKAADFIDRFKAKAGGFGRNRAGEADVVKGLFGEATTPEGKAFADSITEARDVLRGRFNAAGGDIQKRKDWGWTQKHNSTRIREAGEQAWVDFVVPRLAPDRMFNAAGQPMTGNELSDFVSVAYRKLSTNDMEGLSGRFESEYGSPVNARVGHRELAFKDATSWLEYQERFGDGNVFRSIHSELDRMARDVAVMEVLGPYPEAALRKMESLLPEQPSPASGRTERVAQKAVPLRQLWEEVVGHPVDYGSFARVGQINRDLLTASRLGSALILSLVSDPATATLTARMSGLPQARLMRRWLGQLNPASGADRRLAARAGYIAEHWLGSGLAAERMMGETAGSNWSAAVADSSLRVSGLTSWTEGGRSAFGLEFLGFLTDNAHMRFGQLPDALRNTMRRHGISEADWELYRSTNIWRDSETGAEFIRPEDVWLERGLPAQEHQARFKAANAIAEMINAESYYAIVRPTATTRAGSRMSAQRGSFWHEVSKNVLLWKSWPITFFHLHTSRMMQQQGIWNKTKYFGLSLMIPLTINGGLAIQYGTMARGQDPRDMSDPKFWVEAMLRGGAVFPGAEILFAAHSRRGQSWMEEVAGPVFGGQLGSVARLMQAATTEGSEIVGTSLRRLVEMSTPGSSLWYARTAYERLLFDQLQEWLDPHAKERFKRAEQHVRKDGRGHWWRPGRATPDRAPDLGAAIPTEQGSRSGMPSIGLRG